MNDELSIANYRLKWVYAVLDKEKERRSLNLKCKENNWRCLVDKLLTSFKEDFPSREDDRSVDQKCFLVGKNILWARVAMRAHQLMTALVLAPRIHRQTCLSFMDFTAFMGWNCVKTTRSFNKSNGVRTIDAFSRVLVCKGKGKRHVSRDSW